MQPAAEDSTVDVIIVSHRQGAAPTDSDEAIARALEEELADAGAQGAVGGLPPQQLVRDQHTGASRASSDVVKVVEVEVVDFSEPSVAQSGRPEHLASSVELQLPEAQHRAQLPASPMPDQLTEDEALARSLHEQELRQLSEENQERLTRLPALLADSPLVRTLSDRLLQGVDLKKLLPRVNSSIAASAPAERLEAGRSRLEERLKLYCLVERKVKGDGACQFRALSDQLFRTPRLHGFVRECVCRQLAKDCERYAGFIPQDYDAYCRDMARPHTWGDHVTLQAAADHFGLRIMVLASYESSPFLWIEPREQRSRRALWISFFAEVHYNSLYHVDDPPPPLPSDKLLGSRRLHSLLFGSSAAG